MRFNNPQYMKSNKKVHIVGITGGIGCGKSVVSQLFFHRGIAVYDCDNRAKELMVKHLSLRKALIHLVGEELFKDGVFNKPLLTNFLFSNIENKAKLDALVHPVVKADFRQWVADHSVSTLLVIESALLFEAGFTDEVDSVLVVSSPLELRLKRIMSRDHMSLDLAKRKMQFQMDEEKKIQLADLVIHNDERHSLIEQINLFVLRLEQNPLC